MAMRILALVTTLAIGLTACASTVASSNLPYQTKVAFDPAVQAIENGSNRVRGNAVLSTVSGEPRTCAGQRAQLVKSTPYADERMLAIYGNLKQGYRDSRLPPMDFSPAEPTFETAALAATCDSQGNFEFAGVADGAYYVVAPVMWSVPISQYVSRSQGGWLMLHVVLSGGEDRRVVLSSN